MVLFFLVYIGGLLSIFSPCVLPVLPFVFSRSQHSFMRNGLPVLIGMAVTFTLLASFAAVGGAWLVKINQYGRYLALLLLLLLGLALIWPALSDLVMRPFVTLGGRLQQSADKQGKLGGSLLLGVAVGFLWAPCGGPILGLVLTGAALSGANLYTALLLLVFAAGASTSLALALLAGGRILNLMKRGFGAEELVRRILGIAVVVGVIAIALGLDTRFLSKFSTLNTKETEKKLIERLTIQPPASIVVGTSVMPPLSGATLWLNSPPLDSRMLRGKVVLVDFWTYSCINCLRTVPYLIAWDRKYRDQGLIIIGVHSPEFAFEKERKNVEQAIHDLGITYPVAMDNRFAIWNAFDNKAWPAHFLIDAQGRIRHRQAGEGAYDETERIIQNLLTEAHHGQKVRSDSLIHPEGSGVTATASDMASSPETYLGYGRQENFASPEPIRRNFPAQYSRPRSLEEDQWALSGRWVISEENAALLTSGGSISYRFQGRDLHLVLGFQGRNPVRFRVTLDGAAPGDDHGSDIDPQGNGVIGKQKLYQLIRQKGTIKARTFRIEFLDAGAVAFAFTFG